MLLIATAVLSWLVAFNVVNTRNPGRARDRRLSVPDHRAAAATDPLELLPNLGGIDISPVILILLILFLENVIIRYIYPSVLLT